MLNHSAERVINYNCYEVSKIKREFFCGNVNLFDECFSEKHNKLKLLIMR